MVVLCRLGIVLCWLVFPVMGAGGETTLFQSQQNLQPSLVTIKAFTIKAVPGPDGRSRLTGDEQRGNGVVIESSGVVVTNKHVIAGMEHILVTLSDGGVREGVVIHNAKEDFCFIRIKTARPLKAVVRADGSQTKSGVPVIALYHDRVLHKGTITQLIREEAGNRISFLELKLELQPGHSGGPVFSEQGCLLGLVMARERSDGRVSYAVSADRIWDEYRRFNGSTLVWNRDYLWKYEIIRSSFRFSGLAAGPDVS